MNIRIILKDANGKRFTLPVADVSKITWEAADDGKLTCLGPTTPSPADNIVAVVPAAGVVTIYRDGDPAPDDD